jgi:Uma2 family endonuclease
MALTSAFRSPRNDNRSYLRTPVPLEFRTELEVPENGVHLELRTALYLIVRNEVAGRFFVGSEQFLYWDPTNPKKCLAPDLLVHLGAPDLPLPCVKVWERGAPELAVEIVSPSDSSSGDWEAKLEHYRQAGVNEVVRFDPERLDHPLRLWDRIEGDLLERNIDGSQALACDALGLYWCARPDARLGCVLRLARDAEGRELVPTPEEQREIERLAKEAERSAKEAALARVAALEAELRGRGF